LGPWQCSPPPCCCSAAPTGVIEGTCSESTEPLAGAVLITAADPFFPPPSGEDCVRGFGVVGGGVAFEVPGPDATLHVARKLRV